MFQPVQQGNEHLDDRIAYLRELKAKASTSVNRIFQEKFLASWVFHDNSHEGIVYTMEELRAGALETPPSDPLLIPTYDDIRNHRAAFDIMYEFAEKKKQPIQLDYIKKIAVTLAPDETEGKGQPKYRKDIPLHRLYFHDIATPDKIQPKLKQIIEWMNAPETKRSIHPMRLAAKFHFQFMQIYPFPKHSGKIGRVIMNTILIQNDYPPAIIHATERQRYYESLKGPENLVATLVNEAIVASVESEIRYFEEALGLA